MSDQKKSLWERLKDWWVESRMAQKEFEELTRERAEISDKLPRLKAPMEVKVGRFRWWRILGFAVIISFLNWVFWGTLDEINFATGGAGGIASALDTALRAIASQIWNLTCVFPTPSEGSCFELPNIVILVFVLVLVIGLIGVAVNGLIGALREDDEARRNEQIALIAGAVQRVLDYRQNREEAMKRNEEFRKQDEERKKRVEGV